MTNPNDNGTEGQLDEFRKKAQTRFFKDPQRVEAFRARCKKEARKSLLERKIVTEEELEEAEEQVTE